MMNSRLKIWGFIVVLSMIPCVYSSAGIGGNVEPFRSEITGAIGLRTADGRVVAPAVFDEIHPEVHGVCVAKLGNLYGYVSLKGLNITPMIFHEARNFTTTPTGTPFASVRFSDGWNLIDAYGIRVFPLNRSSEITDGKLLGLAAFYLDLREQVRRDRIASESFSRYAKTVINNYLSFWYPKKEYETTQDWRSRITGEKLALKIEELRSVAAEHFVSARGDFSLSTDDFVLCKYDADNSTFLLSHKNFGAVIVPVPRREAAAFRSGWKNAKLLAPDYAIGKNDRVVLRSLDFVVPDGSVYHADPDAVYESTTQFGGFNLVLPGGTESIAIPPRAVLSDVDCEIPVCPKQTERPRFACILVNESYESADNVLFAGEDGFAFEQYCEKTLGIPRERIFRSKNNSLRHMQTALEDLKLRVKSFPNSEIIFFYVGNSVTDRYGNEYLLPTDCRPADGVGGGLGIKELYEELGSLRAKLVSVFLDTSVCLQCGRDGKNRNYGKNMVEISEPVPSGKSIVFRASTQEERSQRFPEKSHGLFTYFLLKKLKETRGDVTLDTLADFLDSEILRTAAERFGTTQTPTVTPSEDLGEEWALQKMR